MYLVPFPRLKINGLPLSCPRFPNAVVAAIIERSENIYLAGFVPLQAFVVFFPFFTSPSSSKLDTPHSDAICTLDAKPNPDILLGTRHIPATAVLKGGGGLEFLPLMLTSVYCSIGLIWSFLRFSHVYIVKCKK